MTAGNLSAADELGADGTVAAQATRPRVDRLTKAIAVLTVIGIGVASYLTFVHYYGLSALACPSGGHGQSSCVTVQSSSYAELAGIPVALLGLIGYITILGSLFIRSDLGRAISFGVALTGFGFSMYLTYREIFTIKAICEWCVSSAVMMTILMVLTAVRFLRAEPGAR